MDASWIVLNIIASIKDFARSLSFTGTLFKCNLAQDDAINSLSIGS